MRSTKFVHILAALTIAVLTTPRAESQAPGPVRVQPIDQSVILSGSDDSERSAERQVYHINPAVDYPIIAIGTAWSAYALTKIYDKTPPTEAEILRLNKNDINAFDRWAIYPYDERLIEFSDYPFYASIPLPLLFFVSNTQTRKDFFKLSLLYWETLSVMGLLGTTSTYLVDRYRPYCYSDQTPMDRRTSKVSKNSFFSGHVEMVAAPTFLIAKVYSDYYPDSDSKWIFYGTAVAVTGVTAYLRLRAGTHFPSDILLGAAVGSLCGILIPEFHKVVDPAFTVLPYGDGESRGIALSYHF